MADQAQETFLQPFTVDGVELTCWWGTSGGAMSFFVFDETNGLSNNASFRLQASDKGNIGMLTIEGVDRILTGTGVVVQITKDEIFEAEVGLSSTNLTSYLNSDEYPLSLAGIQSFSKAVAI